MAMQAKRSNPREQVQGHVQRTRPARSLTRRILPAAAFALLVLSQLGNVAAQQPQQSSGSPKPKAGGLPDIVDFFATPIDPKTPIADLLPAPPKFDPPHQFVVAMKAEAVPTLTMHEPYTNKSSFGTELKKTAHLVAKIDYLNKKKTDGFLEALLENRPDLQGLPFVMGDACRLDQEKGQLFKDALDLMRQAAANSTNAFASVSHSTSKKYADPFWNAFRTFEHAWDDGERPGLPGQSAKAVKPPEALSVPTRLRALMHVMAGQPDAMRIGLVKYLAGTPHVEATKALARLALFDSASDVRQAALTALMVRREKDFDPILLAGLRYPWPTVAQRSADALIKLERKDLAGQLVELLEKPDPRLPKLDKTKDKETYVAQHLVRLNHHQNCLLCHPPVMPKNKNMSHVVAAPVAIPGKPLPNSLVYYGASSTEILIRTDVTYLRPDFSLLQTVPEPAPEWPKTQRFDFLVRSVVMDKKQAELFTAAFKKQTAAAANPYQESVVIALRALTGLDAGSSAPEWRKALKLAS